MDGTVRRATRKPRQDKDDRCEQVRLGVGNGSIPESNEKQSHELGRNLPEGFEDSLIDICWHFPGFLEANKITTEIPKTGQPELGVLVESGAVVSALCSEGFRGHSSEPPKEEAG